MQNYFFKNDQGYLYLVESTYIESEELKRCPLLKTVAEEDFLGARDMFSVAPVAILVGIFVVDDLTPTHDSFGHQSRQLSSAEFAGKFGLVRAGLLVLRRAAQINKTSATQRKANDSVQEVFIQVLNHHLKLRFDLRAQVDVLHDSFEFRVDVVGFRFFIEFLCHFTKFKF